MSIAWRLGRIGPILVSVNYTWILVGGLGLGLLAMLWLPPYLPAASAWVPWALASLILLVYSAGLLLVEVIRTVLVRRVLPGWIPAIQLFPFGAVTPDAERRLGAGRAALLALLTPLVLGGLALGYWVLSQVLLDLALIPLASGTLALALGTGAVAVLHLTPGLPLAGGRLLIALRGWINPNTDGAFSLARLLGLGVALGLAAAGILLILREANWVIALGLITMAWALREGAAAIDRRRSTRSLLERTQAQHLMQPPARVVRPDDTLAAVFWGGERVRPGALLAVADSAGLFRGLLPAARADALLQGTWPRTTVRAIMIPAADLVAVPLDAPLPAVLGAFARQWRTPPAPPADEDDSILPATYVPVVEQRRLRGVISRGQVEEYENQGARAGVQEASELQTLSHPRRSRQRWAGLVLAGGISLLVLAGLGQRVAARAVLPPAPGATAVAPEVTFTDQTPTAGAILGRGNLDLRVAIHSAAPVVSVTMTLDNAPLVVQLNSAAGDSGVTAQARATASLLGPYTVRVQVYGARGRLGQTTWTFRVVPGGVPEPMPTGPAAIPAPIAVTARYPAPGGLLPANTDNLTVYVDLMGRAADATLVLDDRPRATQVLVGRPQSDQVRLQAPVGNLAPGRHTLQLQTGSAAPTTWEFIAQPVDAMHQFFPQTGYFVSGAFLAFWQKHGGLPIFGYPLADPQPGMDGAGAYTVQYFERARMEQHGGGPIVLGLLGREVHPVDPPAAPLPGARYFAETGHNLGGGFREFWEQHGGLAIFGYPISEEQGSLIAGHTYTVQYFERARFEYHPELAGTPWGITLSDLGRQVWPP